MKDDQTRGLQAIGIKNVINIWEFLSTEGTFIMETDFLLQFCDLHKQIFLWLHHWQISLSLPSKL